MQMLRRRTMMGKSGGGGNIIYQASDLTFDGTNYLDTGIPLMDGRDFKMHIVFTPTTLSTSSKYFACREENYIYHGFDLRYSANLWDLVANNTDVRFPTPSPQVNVAVDMTITRMAGVFTAQIGTEIKTPTITSQTTKNLCIGSNSYGNGKAKMYLNELTIWEL